MFIIPLVSQVGVNESEQFYKLTQKQNIALPRLINFSQSSEIESGFDPNYSGRYNTHTHKNSKSICLSWLLKIRKGNILGSIKTNIIKAFSTKHKDQNILILVLAPAVLSVCVDPCVYGRA